MPITDRIVDFEHIPVRVNRNYIEEDIFVAAPLLSRHSDE